MLPTPGNLDVFIDRALEEDSFGADVTTKSLIPPHLEARAFLVPKEPGILAGLEVAAATFRRVDTSLVFTQKLLDGDRVDGGEIVATGTPKKIASLKKSSTARYLKAHLARQKR